MAKQVLLTTSLMRPIAHFSHAVRIGDLVHIGATAGTEPSRRLPGDVAGRVDADAQTRQMFANIGTVLELLGASVTDIVRLKTYVTDLRDLPIYAKHLDAWRGGRPLAHTVVGSWGFPLPQAAIEADLVAIVGAGGAIRGDDGTDAASGSAARCGGRHFATASAARADAAFAIAGRRLHADGFLPRDVVNVHATLRDASDLPALEAAWLAFFGTAAPSRAVVVAPLADPDHAVQIEMTSIRGGGVAIGGNASDVGRVAVSAGVLAGEELYLSGRLGVRAGAGTEAQTRAAWQALSATLGAAGMTTDHVLRTNNVLTDWRRYAAFNAGYGANVTEPYPPRATVLNALCDPAAVVQIEGIAHARAAASTVLTVAGEI